MQIGCDSIRLLKLINYEREKFLLFATLVIFFFLLNVDPFLMSFKIHIQNRKMETQPVVPFK